jgi:hypothetical protein
MMTANVEPVRRLSDPRGLLLAQAALLDGPAAVQAWQQWCRSGYSIERLDYGSYRLLALVFRNLTAAGVADERLATLKGVYRHAWYSNQRLFHHGGGALRALEAAGLPTMLLKGAALVADDPTLAGVRLMDDLDILVREEHLRDAVAVLGAAGWRARDTRPLEVLVGRFHSTEFDHPAGAELDLHWRPFVCGATDEALWQAARGARLAGASTLTPDSADQLALTCLHGLGWDPAPLRWIVDAMLIMRAESGELNWAAAIERARIWNDTRALRDTLTLLKSEFAAPVPPGVLTELEHLPFAPVDAFLHRVKLAPPRTGFGWAVFWRAISRLSLAARPGATGPLGRNRLSVALADLRVDLGAPTASAAIATLVRRFGQLLTDPQRASARWFEEL